jgi:hypothetical protein
MSISINVTARMQQLLNDLREGNENRRKLTDQQLLQQASALGLRQLVYRDERNAEKKAAEAALKAEAASAANLRAELADARKALADLRDSAKKQK